MLTRKSRGISYLAFERLSEQPLLRHGVSLRRPSGQPQSNDIELDFHSRDPKRSRQAKKHFCQALGLKAENLTEAGQTHSSHIHIVRDQKGVIRDTDGICTNTQGLGMMQFGADCPLILVY
ncbi:MAG: laccase domain-containing protein, partial [Planctomycetes bacterium]|nr:laccase domain-containing protein [Planctomycetota bacterium]